MENEVNNYLGKLGDTLQGEADVKVDEVIKLYNECSEDLKEFICRMLNVPYGDISSLRETLDTLELIDMLDGVRADIKSNLELEQE